MALWRHRATGNLPTNFMPVMVKRVSAITDQALLCSFENKVSSAEVWIPFSQIFLEPGIWVPGVGDCDIRMNVSVWIIQQKQLHGFICSEDSPDVQVQKKNALQVLLGKIPRVSLKKGRTPKQQRELDQLKRDIDELEEYERNRQPKIRPRRKFMEADE